MDDILTIRIITEDHLGGKFWRAGGVHKDGGQVVLQGTQESSSETGINILKVFVESSSLST